MAPGLNGRQTGTVPKNKPRNSGSQSHRSTRDALIHFVSVFLLLNFIKKNYILITQKP